MRKVYLRSTHVTWLANYDAVTVALTTVAKFNHTALRNCDCVRVKQLKLINLHVTGDATLKVF